MTSFPVSIPDEPVYPEPVKAEEHHANREMSRSEEKARQAHPSRPVVVHTREQKGHSLVLHLTLGAMVLWIPAMIYSASPNHYWHV